MFTPSLQSRQPGLLFCGHRGYFLFVALSVNHTAACEVSAQTAQDWLRMLLHFLVVHVECALQYLHVWLVIIIRDPGVGVTVRFPCMYGLLCLSSIPFMIASCKRCVSLYLSCICIWPWLLAPLFLWNLVFSMFLSCPGLADIVRIRFLMKLVMFGDRIEGAFALASWWRTVCQFLFSCGFIRYMSICICPFLELSFSIFAE